MQVHSFLIALAALTVPLGAYLIWAAPVDGTPTMSRNRSDALVAQPEKIIAAKVASGESPELRSPVPGALESDRVPRIVVPATASERELFVATVVGPQAVNAATARFHETMHGMCEALPADMSVIDRKRAELLIAEMAHAKTSEIEARYDAIADYIRRSDDLARIRKKSDERGFLGTLSRGLTEREKGFWGTDVDCVEVSYFLAYDEYPLFAEASRKYQRAKRAVRRHLDR